MLEPDSQASVSPSQSPATPASKQNRRGRSPTPPAFTASTALGFVNCDEAARFSRATSIVSVTSPGEEFPPRFLLTYSRIKVHFLRSFDSPPREKIHAAIRRF